MKQNSYEESHVKTSLGNFVATIDSEAPDKFEVRIFVIDKDLDWRELVDFEANPEDSEVKVAITTDPLGCGDILIEHKWKGLSE